MNGRSFTGLVLERAARAYGLGRRAYARLRPVPPDGRLHMDGTFTTGHGERLVRVHSAGSCRGRSCVIHGPSGHRMRGFPTLWRGDRGIMERVCPHGVGHPDPDDMAFHDLVSPGHMEGVHGCDGCCSEDGPGQ